MEPRKISARSDALGFIIGGVFGAAVFLAIWGATPLDPFAFDWIVQVYGGDQSFAMIGALRFLKEPWTFPLGVIKGLIHPAETSIVYVDGVPLFGLAAKLVYRLVGADFQYFGVWGFFCMVLQGGLGALIMNTYARNAIVAGLASLFFVCAPFLLFKQFGHVSMAGQWVLLFPLLLIWRRSGAGVSRRQMVSWPIACGLSVSVLPYFTPMVFALLAIFVLLSVVENGLAVLGRAAVLAISSVGVSALVFWALGGFVPVDASFLSSYGIAPYNLNGLLNPSWASEFLKPLATLPGIGDNGESYSWIGLGVLIAALYVAIDVVLRPNGASVSDLRTGLPFLAVCAVLIGFAATNKVVFGDVILFEYPLDDVTKQILSIFRTSGRFIWPVWYIVVISVLGAVIVRARTAVRGAVAMLALFALQAYDGRAIAMAQTLAVRHATARQPPTNPFWSRMGEVGRNMVMLPFSGRLLADHHTRGYFAYQAVRQGMTQNIYWLGRLPRELIEANMAAKAAEIRAGQLSPDDLVFAQYLPHLVDMDPENRIGKYMVEGQVLLTRADLASMDIGARKVSVSRPALNAFVQHLAAIKDKSIIVLTARGFGDGPPNAGAIDELRSLGVSAQIAGPAPYNFGAIIRSGSKVFESASRNEVAYTSKDGAIQLKVAISGQFPLVHVGAVDYSHAWYGLNVVVVDAATAKVTQVGVFDLSAADAPGSLMELQ